MLETLMQLKHSLWHNLNCIVETTVVWFVWAFCYIVGMEQVAADTPPIDIHAVVMYLLPYLQAISLILACGASLFTIWKIQRDARKK